jgi:hypothetical protein
MAIAVVFFYSYMIITFAEKESHNKIDGFLKSQKRNLFARLFCISHFIIFIGHLLLHVANYLPSFAPSIWLEGVKTFNV